MEIFTQHSFADEGRFWYVGKLLQHLLAGMWLPRLTTEKQLFDIAVFTPVGGTVAKT